MKFCLSWLEERLNVPLDTNSLAEELTMAGLEVVKVNAAARFPLGIVAGQIQEIKEHPQSGNLKLCRVDIGEKTPLQVVCSAVNLVEGMHVPLTREGASDIKGAVSDGTFCSIVELGIGDDPEEVPDLGEDVAVGTEIVEHLQLKDKVFELDLTPNRGDCFSLLGLAREVAAIRGHRVEILQQQSVVATQEREFPVKIRQPKACPRYFSRVVRNLNPDAVTPLWMKARLHRCGVRVLHPVVDIMNYVMLELGQPLHAFDLDKVENEIVVRYAKTGESLELIGGERIELDKRTLLIADAHRPLALAGIAGGADSAVSSTTRDILIECAFFDPAAIAGKARSYGLHTEASLRFERGVDPDLQERALERASELLSSIAGGEFELVSSITTAIKRKRPVTLRYKLLTCRLGIDIDQEAVPEMLTRLGCQVRPCRGGWRCALPSYRFDLDIAEDLIEEIGRLYGYDKISGNHLAADNCDSANSREDLGHQEAYRDHLVGRGYFEVVTYSFVDPDLSLQLGSKPVLQLENPISPTKSVMRASLWPGLLQVLTYNTHRQQERVRIFELGRCFDEQSERLVLAGLVYGDVYPEQWSEAPRAVDFYDVKADVFSLFEGYSEELSCVAFRLPGLHPGQTAKILLDGKEVGCLGALTPQTVRQLGVKADVFLFEIELDKLKLPKVSQVSPISPYPSLRRDLSLLVPDDVDAADIETCIDGLGLQSLHKLVFFDVYVDKRSKTDRKSITLGLIFQDVSSTLDERACMDSVEQVITALASTLKVKLRE